LHNNYKQISERVFAENTVFSDFRISVNILDTIENMSIPHLKIII